MDDIEKYFVDNCKDIKNSADILNWYRNLYYKENNDTERGIIAKAINDLFMKLKDKGVNLKNL